MADIAILGSKSYPYVSLKDTGGIEIYIETLVDILSSTTHNIHIFARVVKDQRKFEKNKQIKIYRFTAPNTFPLRNIAYNFKVFLYVASQEKKYNLVFANGPIAGMFAYFLRVLGKAEKIIYVPHGIGFVQKQYSLLGQIILYLAEKIAYTQSNIVVSLSINEFRKITKLFSIQKKTIIIPSALQLTIAQKPKLAHHKPLKLLYIGRISKIKNIKGLVYALKDLQNIAHLTIYGEGDDKQNIKTLIASLNIKNISLNNALPHNKALKEYKKHDVFVLASFSEGMPLTLIEASSNALPIICSPLIAPSKYIMPINPRNIETIKKAILLLTNKKIYEEYSKKSLELAKTHSYINMKKKIINLVNLLNNN